MCFAPRYSSGPIAAPLSPWRNTASLPDTPCASRPAAHTTRNRMVVTIRRVSTPNRQSPTDPAFALRLGSWELRVVLLALITGMAVVTCGVEVAAGRHDRVLVLCVRGLEGQRPLLHEVAGHLHPVA